MRGCRMSRWAAARSSLATLVFASIALGGKLAYGHGLAMDQVLLQPDRALHVLRGQLTFDPHHTRGEARTVAADTEARVQRAVRESLVIEVDGARCPLEIEIRELWEPAGATVGDIVTLRCPLAPEARELRVHASSAIAVLAVSVQVVSKQAADSRSVVIEGGQWTPIYHLERPDDAWRLGGANQFLPDGGLASPFRPLSQSGRGERATSFEESRAAIGARYARLGFVHILPRGWDHVLFVAGVVLGSNLRARRLLLELSAFTLAHALTLGFGALGFTILPARVVEPLIALSIAFVGFENLRRSRSARGRLATVFGFGFLHGMGFASALAQAGLSHRAFLLSLVAFNVGVEVGQLAVVGVLFAALAALRNEPRRERWVVRPASLVIGVIGVGWALTRTFA